MTYLKLLADSDFIEDANKTWMYGTYEVAYKATFAYHLLARDEQKALEEAIENLCFDIDAVVFLAQYCGFHESFLNFLQRWQPKYELVVTPKKTTIKGKNKAELYVLAAFFEAFFEGKEVNYGL